MSDAGAATFNSDIYLPTKIIHTGDSDTFLEFSAANTWRVVAGDEERFKVASGEVTVNESSQDTDFRVESDNNANMLFVDAGNDRIGIGTASPATALDITGTVTADGLSVDTGSFTINTASAPQITSAGSVKIDIDSDNNATDNRFLITSDGSLFW